MAHTVTLSFTEPEHFREHVRAVDLDLIFTSGGRYEAELQQWAGDRLVLQRGMQSFSHIARVRTPPDRCLLLLPSSPRQDATYDGNTAVNFGDIIYSSGVSENYNRTPKDVRWVSLSPRVGDLSATSNSLVGCDLSEAGTHRVIKPSGQSVRRLLALHQAVCELATTAPEAMMHPEVTRATEESLFRALVACLHDGRDEAASYAARSTSAAIMRRLERVLEANSDRPLYLTEICAAVRTSAWMLRAACQEHLGMSSYRYLLLRRMHLAHRELVRSDPAQTTVTQVANAYGFGELGRFAVRYRQMFGEPPSKTLLRPVDGGRQKPGFEALPSSLRRQAYNIP